MIRFDVEWLPPPPVRDRVLAETWASLRIEFNDAVPTTLIDNAAMGARRSSVDGSVFPLAEWLVENWWSLLCEGPHDSPGRLRPGREAARHPTLRRWVSRHNLLAAREGGALPDLYLFRDADSVAALWRPDPSVPDSRARFVEHGDARVPLDEFRQHAGSFVDAVLGRLQTMSAPAVESLKADWRAIRSATPEEELLCGALARLGCDPYDPDQVTDTLEHEVEASLARLDASAAAELLSASSPARLAGDAAWVARADGKSRTCLPGAPLQQHDKGVVGAADSAHRRGYERARAIRAGVLHLDDDARIDSLADLLTNRLGWSDKPLKRLAASDSTDIEAAVVGIGSGPAVYSARTARVVTGDRFKLARALHAWGFGSGPARTRLVTRAFTWDQRASRAFAAELLAPSAGLRKILPERCSYDDVDAAARHFDVSPLCVEYQIENHEIGVLAA